MSYYGSVKQLLTDQGIADAVPAADAAAQLNAPSITQYRTLTGDDVLIWAAGHQVDYDSLIAAAPNGDHLAKMALKLIDDPTRVLNLARADVQAWVQALVSDGVLSAAGSTALYSMAAHNVSPAEAAGLGEITPGDVEEARRIG